MSSPAPKHSSRRRGWLTALGIAVVLVVAVVVNRTTVNRTTAKRETVSPLRSSLIAKANLPDCPTTTGAGKVANGLPALTFPCLANGPKVDLARLRGPLVVNIWAGTCAPCRTEAPQLRAFAAAAGGQVAVLGVVDGAYSGESWDDALDASRGLALGYPSAWDASGKLVGWTRSIGIPDSLLIAADGSIAYRKFGPLAPGELPKLVKQYLGVDVQMP